LSEKLLKIKNYYIIFSIGNSIGYQAIHSVLARLTTAVGELTFT